MELVSYQPEDCVSGEKVNCDQLIAYAWFDVASTTSEEAMMQFFTTLFTCVVLTIASYIFQWDTKIIAVKPITKMVQIIEKIAVNPLALPEKWQEKDDENEKNAYMKTKMLYLTVFKIGTLLSQIVGVVGSWSVAENIQANDNTINPMIPGTKYYHIFLYCWIN